MNVFQRTPEIEKLFSDFTSLLEEIACEISSNASSVDVSLLTGIQESFRRQTEDFFRAERKLNIGIIGQIKAGKSSFLNTMLFAGHEVLPKASTPKTAALTKIEYSAESYLEVEYYTTVEWESLRLSAAAEEESDERSTAREILKLAEEGGAEAEDYLGRGRERLIMASDSELRRQLNRYVGEDGELTPFVKMVTLGINRSELENISVVDTPGLNDPIVSRTDKTKQFIELCDVVFFLSRASNFLDASDIRLLTAQLPAKGVKKLVLICSRYDDGLQDVLFDKGSLEEANKDTQKRMKRHAIQTFDKILLEKAAKDASSELLEIIGDCKKPIFVSAMACNMSRKSPDEYNTEEKLVFDNLNIYAELDDSYLEKIGNIAEVEKVFAEVIADKDKTLLKKAESFIPLTKEKLRNALETMRQTIEKRRNMLAGNDREVLLEKQKAIEAQIKGIHADLEIAFGELYVKLEQSKQEATKDLRQASSEFSRITERTGTETKVEHYQVSTSKWYNPFSWGTSRTESSTYQQSYTYVEVSDALEKIRDFAAVATTKIEEVFYRSIEINIFKRKLLQVVTDNFDMSDENIDPIFFKLLTEKTLNAIELPIINLEIEGFISELSGNFSGEIRSSGEKDKLKSKLAESIGRLFSELSDKFIVELKAFKGKLQIIQEGFSGALLENINSEFELLLKQSQDKEKEIALAEKMMELLLKLSEKVPD